MKQIFQKTLPICVWQRCRPAGVDADASLWSHELVVCMSKTVRVLATPLPTSYPRQSADVRIFHTVRFHYLFDSFRDHSQHHSTSSMLTERVRTRQRWESVGVMGDKEQKLENVETSRTLGGVSCTTRHIDRVGFVNSMDLCVCVSEVCGYVEVTVWQDRPVCLEGSLLIVRLTYQLEMVTVYQQDVINRDRLPTSLIVGKLGQGMRCCKCLVTVLLMSWCVRNKEKGMCMGVSVSE